MLGGKTLVLAVLVIETGENRVVETLFFIRPIRLASLAPFDRLRACMARPRRCRGAIGPAVLGHWARSGPVISGTWKKTGSLGPCFSRQWLVPRVGGPKTDRLSGSSFVLRSGFAPAHPHLRNNLPVLPRRRDSGFGNDKYLLQFRFSRDKNCRRTKIVVGEWWLGFGLRFGRELIRLAISGRGNRVWNPGPKFA